MRIFLRPLFSIAATKFLSSHEFMDERSMGSFPGNTARSCGHIFPLKDFVSTVVKTTGTSNTLAAMSCQGLDDKVGVATEFRTLARCADVACPCRPLGSGCGEARAHHVEDKR